VAGGCMEVRGDSSHYGLLDESMAHNQHHTDVAAGQRQAPRLITLKGVLRTVTVMTIPDLCSIVRYALPQFPQIFSPGVCRSGLRALLKSRYPYQSSDRELDGCDGDESGEGIGEVLEILGQAPVAS
jgi:hypothetical protein